MFFQAVWKRVHRRCDRFIVQQSLWQILNQEYQVDHSKKFIPRYFLISDKFIPSCSLRTVTQTA